MSTNRYPVARPQPVRPSRPVWVPANDNRPRVRVPIPANDNWGGRLARPAGASRIPAAAAARMLPRVLARAIPLVGFAWTAWELYNLWKDWSGSSGFAPPVGWVKLSEEPRPTDTWRPSSWGGFKAWSYRGGSPFPAYIWPGDTYPLPDTFPDADPHYWWEWVDYPPGYWPPGEEYQAVRSVWGRDFSVENPLPPREVLVPDIPYIEVPWEIPLPLKPTPVPVNPPVRPPWGRPPNAENPDPGGEPSVPPRPVSPLNPRPPGPGVRERKVKGNRGFRAVLGAALSGYSEVGDLVDAIYDALPKKYQLKTDKTIADKLKTLWKHIDRVRMGDAMANIVEDQVSDPKMAEAFDYMQKQLEAWGLDVPGLRGVEGSSGIWSAIR